jgi:hypothetical protein
MPSTKILLMVWKGINTADQQPPICLPSFNLLRSVNGVMGVCCFIRCGVRTDVVDGFDVWVRLEEGCEGGFVGVAGWEVVSCEVREDREDGGRRIG